MRKQSIKYLLFIVRMRGALTGFYGKALADASHKALLKKLGGVVLGYELYPLKKIYGEPFQHWYLELLVFERPSTTVQEIRESLSKLKGVEVQSVNLVGRGALSSRNKKDIEVERTPMEEKRIAHAYNQSKSRARQNFVN